MQTIAYDNGQRDAEQETQETEENDEFYERRTRLFSSPAIDILALWRLLHDLPYHYH